MEDATRDKLLKQILKYTCSHREFISKCMKKGLFGTVNDAVVYLEKTNSLKKK